MVTRKGMNISGNYPAPHIYYMPCSYMYFAFFLNERSDKIVLTLRPSDTVFSFQVKSNSSQRLCVRIEFLKIQI